MCRRRSPLVPLALALAAALPLAAAAQAALRTFATPEEAVRGLAEAAKAGSMDQVVAIFGPDGQELVASSDAQTVRRNLETFTVAFAEGWKLVDQAGGKKGLVIGNEAWPFPVPLVRKNGRWQFDTAAGKEEVLARRIGRNELAAIETCRTYVAAQRRYALDGHDGKPAGLYATTLRSDEGRQNGLYWAAARGQKRSPLGDLVAEAAEDGQSLATRSSTPQPFHGYYFRILTAQGAHVTGGAKSYIVNGEMTGGFAMVAWPAQYDATGVMTFVVDQSGIPRQKDLGPDTDKLARAMTAYNPDKSWTIVK